MTPAQMAMLRFVATETERGEVREAAAAARAVASYAVGLPALLKPASDALYELRKVVRLAAAAHGASPFLAQWSEVGDVETIDTLADELEGAISLVRAIGTWGVHFASETAPVVKLAERFR